MAYVDVRLKSCSANLGVPEKNLLPSERTNPEMTKETVDHTGTMKRRDLL